MVNSNIKMKGSYDNKTLGVFFENNPIEKGMASEAKYLANISAKDKFTYVGTLNENLQRKGVGLNIYNCGDSYFGYWEKDEKFLTGVYTHKPENGISEFYAGDWEKAKRNGFGVYVWRKDNQPEDKAIMDVFIGIFKEGAISRGLYVSRQLDGDKVKSNYYYGNFVNGKKSDDNALYYLSSSDTMFEGVINEDNIIKGKIYKAAEKRAFRFEKHEEEYLPDEVTEDEANGIKKIYDAFKNFDDSNKIKLVLTGLVKKIAELTTHYKVIDNFKKGEVFLLELLEMKNYQSIFKELNLAVKA